MQRCADLVRSDHILYLSGSVKRERAQSLYEKFRSLYPIALTHVQGTRARKHGESTARLLFYWPGDSDQITWVLLRTAGQLPPAAQDAREKWKNALKERLTAPGGYEIFRMTKPQEPKPVWTFRYTREQYAKHRYSIR
jgi:hypothetical protein